MSSIPEKHEALNNPLQTGNVADSNYIETGLQGDTRAYGSATIMTDGSLVSEKSADYDITDTDHLGGVLMNTGSTDKTSKLPLLGTNQGREIVFCKTGTGNYIIDGDGATINSSATQTVTDNNSAMRVKAFPSEWRII